MKSSQSGSTIVEFALSLVIFLTFFLGITDFSRMLFTWNAANEATRMGARYAVVCDNNTSNEEVILGRMQRLLPQIAEIGVQWVPEACSPSTCEGVTVSILNLDYQWISPIGGLAAMAAIRMPEFSTYLPREVMRQDPNSGAICS